MAADLASTVSCGVPPDSAKASVSCQVALRGLAGERGKLAKVGECDGEFTRRDERVAEREIARYAAVGAERQ